MRSGKLHQRFMNRRTAIKAMGGALSTSLFSHSFPEFALAADRPPNIIFILTDDHRWDALSYLNHPIVKTPNMDRLAEEGVIFKNAFVTTSLCSPARGSFLTGQYAHTHGVINNLSSWNNDNTTFLELLKKAGYDTAFIGKWHMPGKYPQLRGVDRFISFTVQKGQGRYFDCPLIIDGVETERKNRYITEDLTDYALEFIQQERKNPFCLYLSHKAVHHQFLPPPELNNLYADAKLKLPKEYNSFVSWTQGLTYSGVIPPMEMHYRNYMEALTAVDQQLGRILEQIEEMGIADNTVIVYAGDNGFFWGEHRLVDKRWPYEEAIRIPFIVRYPGLIKQPGRASEEMVLNIDLGPTLLDLAGVTVPKSMQGKSIQPILENRDFNLRDSWHYEYYKEFPYNAPEMHAVRTREYIYIEFVGRRKPELYNIINDPRNKDNLMLKPEGQQVLPYLKKLLQSHLRGVNHAD